MNSDDIYDKKTITPTDGVFDSLSDERKAWVQSLVRDMLDCFDGGDWPQAKWLWEETPLDNEERIAAWGFLDSKMRAYLKGDRYNEQDAGWVDKEK